MRFIDVDLKDVLYTSTEYRYLKITIVFALEILHGSNLYSSYLPHKTSWNPLNYQIIEFSSQMALDGSFLN